MGSVVSDRIKSYFELFLRLLIGRDYPGQASFIQEIIKNIEAKRFKARPI